MSASVALGYAFAVASGIGLALQSGINASLGVRCGPAFSAVASFTGGLISVLVFFAFDVTLRGTPLPTLAAAKGVPAWGWLGGPLGALFVASLIVFAPTMGAGSFIALYTTAQIAAACVLDLLGALGYPKRAFSWQRAVGVALLAVGVLLVTLYPGATLAPGAAGGKIGGSGSGGGGGEQGRGPPIGRSLTHAFLRRPPPPPPTSEGPSAAAGGLAARQDGAHGSSGSGGGGGGGGDDGSSSGSGLRGGKDGGPIQAATEMQVLPPA